MRRSSILLIASHIAGITRVLIDEAERRDAARLDDVIRELDRVINGDANHINLERLCSTIVDVFRNTINNRRE